MDQMKTEPEVYEDLESKVYIDEVKLVPCESDIVKCELVVSHVDIYSS